MKKLGSWYVAIALLISLILDGVLAKFFQGIFFHNSFGVCCWSTIVAITVISIIDDQNINNIWLTLAIGIIADSMYLGFFGAYTVAFPLICFLAQRISRYLPDVFLPRMLICQLSYFIVMCYLFLIFNIIGIIRLSFLTLLKSIIPSLVVCLIFTLAFYKFWVYLARKHAFLSNYNNY